MWDESKRQAWKATNWLMRTESHLESTARRLPDKIALVAGETRMTFAELETMANRLAHCLIQRGIERHDRVVLFLDNSIETVASIYAVLKAGAVFSLVNPTVKADKLAFILNHCRPKAVITQAAVLAVAAEAVRQAPLVTTTFVAGAADDLPLPGAISLEAALCAAPTQTPPPNGIDSDLAMIIYTSGSTGFPKGVMMTHRNMEAAATSTITYLEITEQDTILNVLPLSFGYGLYQALMCVQMGATLVLEKSFAFPWAVLKKIQKEQATGFPLVPTIAAMILQLRDLTPGQFPSLRFLTNAGAALPPAHIARLQELFPTTRIFSMYGQTECKRTTYLPPDQIAIRPTSVGKAIPNTEAYVINERGERAAPGEIGQLVVRGPHVMQGYWEDPAATAKALRPGEFPWEKVLYTGDLFRTDDEGYLYFVGRTDDIIKTRGEKVSPTEVERVICRLEGVREAVVLGVPDPVLGEAVKAVVSPVPDSGLTVQQVQRHCAAHLEDFMRPKFIELCDDLPRTDSGKLSRLALRQMLEKERLEPCPKL
jgi:long-chain acyl-CoA synthetase